LGNSVIFVDMNKKQAILKITVSALFIMAIQVAFAAFSFTGITEERSKNSKYSLKNLSSLSHKSITYSSLKNSLQFKGTQFMGSKDGMNSAEMNSMMRFDNGNTTYVYPYKFKVKVATKLKTPVAPHH
jgi:hypothetical protein